MLESNHNYRREFVKRLNILLDELYDGDTDYMARDIGISRRSLQYYLEGKRMPTIDILVKIKVSTGETFEWILGFSRV